MHRLKHRNRRNASQGRGSDGGHIARISAKPPFAQKFRAHFTWTPAENRPAGFERGTQMILLFDPYANRHWSMAEIRLVNKVADALFLAHDDLDLGRLDRAIRNAYRPGTHPHALKTHVERDLKLDT
jgi:hypothetical protein